ncbi:hypothetical protein CAPTEDRAFT_224063 [Capitella teleta]|uniref:Uncharacterized protein n=1 Tax=Capitella teleta TaxID=283909 RepID=R7THD2_CAPTE|nr:hypothetical protein CAPTEDRAFT_224063 [Capitella teleta]|eukprot:ELT92842.1 hypothetical protein CAPTEDRAFT_224063 [Capitella teleta]
MTNGSRGTTRLSTSNKFFKSPRGDKFQEPGMGGLQRHKYIRIGGGYRHSYLYVKAMMEELEIQKLTYYGNQGLQSWDKDEVKAITTYIRTKSGRRVAKLVYVTKDEYDQIQGSHGNADDILKKYVKLGEGETVDGWGEAEMKAIKTMVRTKSGRLIEKTIMVTKDDYDRLQKIIAEGGDSSQMADIIGNYMTMEQGQTLEGIKKVPQSEPMKVVKAMIRTKSGRLVEQTILMTEEEYKAFQEGGGDLNLLKKYMKLGKDDVIENWEKGSTVYSASDDEDLTAAKAGTKIVGKDGEVYEIVVDPLTGKKYKKKVGGKGSDFGKGRKGGKGGGKPSTIGAQHHEDPNEKGMTKKQKEAYRAGKRREDSDSDFSYRSIVSAGGTRHVRRRRKRADGTYSDSDSYHSDQDEAGKKRRQARRGERKVKAIKEKKKKLAMGKRDDGSASDFSYRSVVSAGGTRHVKRRRKNVDGTYGDEESYHSSQDEEGQKRRKKRREKRKEAIRQGKRNEGSDSDFSYKSVVSAGGTRHVRRRKKNADGTYGDEESYHSSQDEDGRTRRRRRRQERQAKFKKGGRNEASDSDFSYRSVVSAGGTRHVKRRKKNVDGTYGDEESYHSSQDEDGQARRRRRRRDRKHGGSANSYYSVVSEGGTRKVRRRKKNADGTYGDSESYHSEDSDFFDEKKLRRRKKKHEHGSDSEHSYFSEVSAGGTKRRMRRQRIRDKDGKVIGYGKKEDYSSPSEYETDSSASSYEMKSDGKGGLIRVKKPKKSKKDKKKKKGGGPDGNMTDFSDELQSTDSEDEPDLSKMTASEKEKYFEAKAKRKAEREKKRKEKYGDKYEEMMEKHQAAKEASKKMKSMVHYESGTKRFGDDDPDNRGLGLGHDDWGPDGKKKKGKKGGKGGGPGSDGDEDSDYSMDEDGVMRKKKKKRDDDEESLYEYVRDKDGNVMMDKDGKPIKRKVGTIKKGKKAKGLVDDDSDFEYKYDEFGNLVRKKKGEPDPESDGDYFETLEDGTVVLRKGKKKIDITKLTEDDLRKLGLDPRMMTKEEIARILKERFGDEISIVRGGKKIGLKHVDEMDGANTDELAADSDLDTSTLTGQRRVRVLMKRGGQALQEHMKKMIENSCLTDPDHVHPEEKDKEIDFLQHYQLVDTSKLDMYARAFVVEDDDLDCVIYAREAKLALDGVPCLVSISNKQLQYITQLLNIDQETNVTFRMFAVMSALAERVTEMDEYCKKLLEVCELTDIERKIELYRAMFYCNVPGDQNANYIKAESLRIELMAGGLNWDQQEYIMERMAVNDWREISFLDYLAYIPLFMSMHDGMCDNPLDMSNTKYMNRVASAQRDMNPLSNPMSKQSPFMNKHPSKRGIPNFKQIDNLTSTEGSDVFNKYQKLPHIKSNPLASLPRKK